jgi:hypothetical protein
LTRSQDTLLSHTWKNIGLVWLGQDLKSLSDSMQFFRYESLGFLYFLIKLLSLHWKKKWLSSKIVIKIEFPKGNSGK